MICKIRKLSGITAVATYKYLHQANGHAPTIHDDGPNYTAHIARKNALCDMKQASGYEGEFGTGAWAFDVEVLKMQPRGFKTPADRNAVIDAVENLGGHVDVWAVHYLARTDNKTATPCLCVELTEL